MDLELRVEESGPRRDLLWDQVMKECGIDVEHITSGARGRYNAAVGQLRRVRACAEDVVARAEVFRVRFPHSPLTPSSLTRHWPELKPQPVKDRHVGRCSECGEVNFAVGTGRMECRCE